MMHICGPSTLKMEVIGQPQLHDNFKASLATWDPVSTPTLAPKQREERKHQLRKWQYLRSFPQKEALPGHSPSLLKLVLLLFFIGTSLVTFL